MSNHFDVRAYRAAITPPKITLSDGTVLTGKPISANKALEWEGRFQDGELPNAVQAIRDALNDFGFNPDTVLDALAIEEVGEALRGFFGFQTSSSNGAAPSPTPPTPTSRRTTKGRKTRAST